ncbi:MAG TPA: hypothetical protein VHS78_12285 [Candidatus Elarobacter sp.]|jgi:hypothetical protein|nr:hypothetical protein [Candidatus Elarobacter sp.]
MAGIDALAAAAALDANLAAQIDAELAQLASDAQALRSLLVEDMVVTARVLPSNGLTDLVEIAGRRVAASLPPTVRPGEVLQVQVTGFDGERILLQVVGTGADAAIESPAVAAPWTPSAVAVAAEVDAAVTSSLSAAATGAPAASASGSAAAAPASAGVGGSAAVGTPPAAVPRSQPGAAFSSAISRATVAPPSAASATVRPAAPGSASAVFGSGAAAGGLRQPVVPPAAPTSIEARVAAARAAAAASGIDQVAPESSVQARTATVSHRFVAPPQIEPQSQVRSAAPARSSATFTAFQHGPKIGASQNEAKVAASQANAKSSAPNPIVQSGVARASQLSAYAEPVAMLRALRLAVTPSNVASAALALQHPERLPNALAALERALPSTSGDPNVATLRTLLAFVGRIDPRSPALAAQIAAYVDHVVDGAEPKLATLLAASRAATPEPDASDDAPPVRGSADPSADVPPLPAAVAVERGAALNADLKQTLMSLATNPATPESLAPSLAGALTALTAVQVTAAQTLAANPNGLAFTIPLAAPHGTSNAHISVKRDAPHAGGARLDAENFRIAFVLETAHYGTVAIDLVTVGREVTVDVRTEAAPAMRAFRDALGSLTARLESLRYRVASAGASLGTTSTVAVEAPPSRPVDPDAAVDRSA